MFGLVPKPLWEKRCPPGPDNAIPQRCNVLLIHHPNGSLGLVDTGCGDPAWYPQKARALHQLEPSWHLRQSLSDAQVDFADIDWVLLSHAHWDHAGALLTPDGAPVFPNATLHLRATEWALATGGDPLLYKSYPENIVRALQTLKHRVHLVEDDHPEVLPGIHMYPAVGHTDGQACICFAHPELPGQPDCPAALFTGDNCPTQHHLRMVFQTAYDTQPLQTRAWKRYWFPRCAKERIPLLFTHDPDIYGAWIQPDPRQEYVATPLPAPESAEVCA